MSWLCKTADHVTVLREGTISIRDLPMIIRLKMGSSSTYCMIKSTQEKFYNWTIYDASSKKGESTLHAFINAI